MVVSLWSVPADLVVTGWSPGDLPVVPSMGPGPRGLPVACSWSSSGRDCPDRSVVLAPWWS